MWKWLLRMWDNGGKNIKLDQGEFIDIGPLSRDPTFNVATRRTTKGSMSLVGWLTHGPKCGPW